MYRCCFPCSADSYGSCRSSAIRVARVAPLAREARVARIIPNGIMQGWMHG